MLLEIVRLRAERAALLGYDTHAGYITSDETAGSPEAVHDLLHKLAVPAARNAVREQAALQAIIDAESQPFPLEAHDWAFYTEKVRAAEYDLDRSALRPWFEAERVIQDGVFRAATDLYGITFAERGDLSAYHPDARVFEVSNADGSALGLFILDLYTRDTKRGGAWMNSIVSQSRLRGTKPIVVNNLNVPKPAPGMPALLTLDEVTTLFHEFGHALHGLFATVTYPHFAGTNVFRDFVEFPSQVNEMWIYWPEILAAYARHVDTGEPLPAEIVEKLHASEAFNQGFATSEYLAAAWLDQAWHSLTAEQASAGIDVAEFEASALAEIGLDNPAVPTRYSSTYFAHVFSGGYSAGYYSYIWSEVLDADTVQWFRENGGLTRGNGDRFRDRLLGVGGSKDPLEAYRDSAGGMLTSSPSSSAADWLPEASLPHGGDPGRCRGARSHAELRAHIGDVPVDRVRADVQSRGYLGIGQAVRDQGHDLAFAGGEESNAVRTRHGAGADTNLRQIGAEKAQHAVGHIVGIAVPGEVRRAFERLEGRSRDASASSRPSPKRMARSPRRCSTIVSEVTRGAHAVASRS